MVLSNEVLSDQLKDFDEHGVLYLCVILRLVHIFLSFAVVQLSVVITGLLMG